MIDSLQFYYLPYVGGGGRDQDYCGALDMDTY